MIVAGKEYNCSLFFINKMVDHSVLWSDSYFLHRAFSRLPDVSVPNINFDNYALLHVLTRRNIHMNYEFVGRIT